MAFKKAVKYGSKLRMAIAGPAGSGKTWTALTLATALAGSGKIAVIDTEHRTSEKYADTFDFDMDELTNFNPNNYIASIKEAEQAGYSVLIIDSLSHAWTGSGGLMEQKDNIAKQKYSGNTFAAWNDATKIQNTLVNAILSCKMHVIVTVRSKMEYIIEPGQKTPRKVGLAPVQRDDLPYEFDVFTTMDTDNTMIVDKSRCPELSGAVIAKPDEQVAEVLKRWLDGIPAPERPVTVKDAYEHFFALGLVKGKTEFYQRASEVLGITVTAENVMSLEQDALKSIIASTEMQKSA